MVIYTIIFAALLAGDIALCILYRKHTRLEKDFDAALSVISGLTAVIGKHTGKFEETEKSIKANTEAAEKNAKELADFKERFDDVMTAAEEQVKEEERWNKGLNNILNFCLDDAYKAGGKLNE